ncbi:hypothetical protein PIB30_063333 [Stylosanthes scabra]|uniref:Uncharacterized protein n=1 Tax=Stylosanthes scabra TaxID=79078 RepID=A0ABU6VN51_9FABA|nr:hypothetical protein [Stylosanthes scabra]
MEWSVWRGRLHNLLCRFRKHLWKPTAGLDYLQRKLRVFLSTENRLRREGAIVVGALPEVKKEELLLKALFRKAAHKKGLARQTSGSFVNEVQNQQRFAEHCCAVENPSLYKFSDEIFEQNFDRREVVPKNLAANPN